MLVDILSSLRGFGFSQIFGINAHGDIDHNLAIIEAFREARAKLGGNTRYCFDETRIPLFGLAHDDAFLCPVRPSAVKVSGSNHRDVHGGDLETATIHRHYPDLVDTSAARKLPPVEFQDDRANDWLFGGHIHELSPEGYIGAPADFEQVDVAALINDQASRITEAILSCLTRRA